MVALRQAIGFKGLSGTLVSSFQYLLQSPNRNLINFPTCWEIFLNTLGIRKTLANDHQAVTEEDIEP